MPRSSAKSSEETSSYRVQVLERAIDILECFSPQRSELNIQALVELTGLNRSTTRRLVAILRRRGLLQEDPDTRKYRLGLWLFKMGERVPASFSLRVAAAQAMGDLKKHLDGTILLSTRHHDEFVVLDKWESVAVASMPTRVGMSRPITFGPLGRVFMSDMDEEHVAALLLKWPLQVCTTHSIGDTGRFYEALAKTSELGYALEIEEVVEGIMAIAAPIRDFSNDIVAALCVGFPATRQADTEYVSAAIGHVKAACADVSRCLGYAGGAEAGGL